MIFNFLGKNISRMIINQKPATDLEISLPHSTTIGGTAVVVVVVKGVCVKSIPSPHIKPTEL